MKAKRQTSGKFPEAVERHQRWWANIAEGRVRPPRWLGAVIERKRWQAEERLRLGR